MPEIFFPLQNKNINVKPQTLLIDAVREAGISIDSPCGGGGTCGRCKVLVTGGSVDSGGVGLLGKEAADAGYVLACRARVKGSALTVEVPDRHGKEGGKFVDSQEDILLVGRELFPKKEDLRQLSDKRLLSIPPPKKEDGLSDIDRLTRSLQQEYGSKNPVFPLDVIRKTSDSLRARDGTVTVALSETADCLRIVGIEPGDGTGRKFGIAVDVGTTTVSVKLVNLGNADIIETLNDYNGQIECGLDVISRINYAKKPGRLEDLRAKVLGTVNGLITKALSKNGVFPDEVICAVISGNTTMTHILLGLKPEYIRLDPYTPTLLEVPYFTASDTGIDINPCAPVQFSPAVGSYVGGDITAGLLCTGIASDTDDIYLFIDIGTNGEIVLGNREFLMACACSAGPAFEGGGIDCGMRAAAGAIEGVEVDPESAICRYWTVGDSPPAGICGSGMISLIAGLFLSGWIDAAGKLDRTRTSPVITANGRDARYTVAPADEGKGGKPVYISEHDIENIIRAKAAIFSACRLMLEHAGMGFEDLEAIYIAGGFGRFLDIEKAKTIGLVPELPLSKFRYIGNSSLVGSYMALVSRTHRERQLKMSRRMTYLELSTEPAYMNQYTAALFLPHTDADLFPGVRQKKVSPKDITK